MSWPVQEAIGKFPDLMSQILCNVPCCYTCISAGCCATVLQVASELVCWHVFVLSGGK
jgi:hypothetical protein